MIADHDASDVPPSDLTPLDPLANSGRFDRLAQSIVRDGMAARRTTIVATPQGAMAHVARLRLRAPSSPAARPWSCTFGVQSPRSPPRTAA